jgi:hypothetical protein
MGIDEWCLIPLYKLALSKAKKEMPLLIAGAFLFWPREKCSAFFKG